MKIALAPVAVRARSISFIGNEQITCCGIGETTWQSWTRLWRPKKRRGCRWREPRGPSPSGRDESHPDTHRGRSTGRRLTAWPTCEPASHYLHAWPALRIYASNTCNDTISSKFAVPCSCDSHGLKLRKHHNQVKLSKQAQIHAEPGYPMLAFLLELQYKAAIKNHQHNYTSTRDCRSRQQ